MKPLPFLCLPHAAWMLAGAAMLSSCGPRDNDPGPGGVTVGEARALDQAAQMIDQQKLPKEALETGAPNGSEAPAMQSSPSGTAAR